MRVRVCGCVCRGACAVLLTRSALLTYRLCCGKYDYVWDPIEWVCVIFFSVDYFARIMTCPVEYGIPKPDELEEADEQEGSRQGSARGPDAHGRSQDETIQDANVVPPTLWNSLKARFRFAIGFCETDLPAASRMYTQGCLPSSPSDKLPFPKTRRKNALVINRLTPQCYLSVDSCGLP